MQMHMLQMQQNETRWKEEGAERLFQLQEEREEKRRLLEEDREERRRALEEERSENRMRMEEEKEEKRQAAEERQKMIDMVVGTVGTLTKALLEFGSHKNNDEHQI
jgi:uncharacterized protein (DUF342 family)